MKTDNTGLDDLARRIRQRAHPDAPDSWRGPYILFLGEQCARAAGAPTAEKIAREALRTFGLDTSPSSEGAPEQEVIDRFVAQTEHLSSSQIVRMVRSLFAGVPVPSFYQDLALLVREHYFPLILTTNFDNLLEQALAAAGVSQSEYQVTSFASRWRSSPPASAEPSPREPLTHLVKLHGDLAQDTVLFSPDQVETALQGSRQWIKAELKGDLIMVGHELSGDPIDNWLSHSRDRQLWWVSVQPPDDPAVRSWSTEHREITGDVARPQVFFSQLALRLLRETEPVSAPEMMEVLALGAEAEVAEGVAEAPTETAAEEPLAEILQREVRRNQSVLYSLEQELPPGQRPTQMQAQIDYQKRQISKLEEKIRSIPEVRPRLVEVVRKIGADILSAYADPSTSFAIEDLAQFVETQAATIERELGKEIPNQFLVSASLGATLTLADRLLTEFGAKVVDPDSVKQLAALVPTAATKVVL
jgi:SIR2-like domain